MVCAELSRSDGTSPEPPLSPCSHHNRFPRGASRSRRLLAGDRQPPSKKKCATRPMRTTIGRVPASESLSSWHHRSPRRCSLHVAPGRTRLERRLRTRTGRRSRARRRARASRSLAPTRAHRTSILIDRPAAGRRVTGSPDGRRSHPPGGGARSRQLLVRATPVALCSPGSPTMPFRGALIVRRRADPSVADRGGSRPRRVACARRGRIRPHPPPSPARTRRYRGLRVGAMHLPAGTF